MGKFKTAYLRAVSLGPHLTLVFTVFSDSLCLRHGFNRTHCKKMTGRWMRSAVPMLLGVPVPPAAVASDGLSRENSQILSSPSA